MTKPPANWQDTARAKLKEVWDRMLQLSTFGRLVKDALAADSYKEYQEALGWLNAEEREPDG